MPAAVDLQELALAGHALAAAAVAGRTPGPDRTDGGLGRDPPQGPLRNVEILAFGEQLGQVAVVDPRIGRRRELDGPVADRGGDAKGRGPLTVAVDEAGRTVGPIASEAAGGPGGPTAPGPAPPRRP